MGGAAFPSSSFWLVLSLSLLVGAWRPPAFVCCCFHPLPFLGGAAFFLLFLLGGAALPLALVGGAAVPSSFE